MGRSAGPRVNLRKQVARSFIVLALLAALVASRWNAAASTESTKAAAKPAEFACSGHHCGCSTREKCESACCCSREVVASEVRADPDAREERLDIATLTTAPRDSTARAVVRPLGCGCGDSPQSIASSASGCANAPAATSSFAIDPPANFELAAPAPARSRTKPEPPAPPPRVSVSIA
jgi:hypothetical protein